MRIADEEQTEPSDPVILSPVVPCNGISIQEIPSGHKTYVHFKPLRVSLIGLLFN